MDYEALGNASDDEKREMMRTSGIGAQQLMDLAYEYHFPGGETGPHTLRDGTTDHEQMSLAGFLQMGEYVAASHGMIFSLTQALRVGCYVGDRLAKGLPVLPDVVGAQEDSRPSIDTAELDRMWGAGSNNEDA